MLESDEEAIAYATLCFVVLILVGAVTYRSLRPLHRLRKEHLLTTLTPLRPPDREHQKMLQRLFPKAAVMVPLVNATK